MNQVSLTSCGLLFLAIALGNSCSGALSLKPAVEGPSDFPLVVQGSAAEIVVDKSEADVVDIAAELLTHDVERVSGVRPKVSRETASKVAPLVIIGTIGKSGLIADLAKRGEINLKAIEGKWESSVITTVANPLPGVAKALVIAGSDRRGAAYGALSVSETIGVSPWEWWADVSTQPRKTLVVSADRETQGPPSVKYRGIFINDEDWGFQPWAAKTFEPETKDIGPKTYAKVCELLLRLKANFLWPAMHPCTKGFNFYPENKVVADKYAIVMGSSHAEPMLRNNVSEWTGRKEDWNYEKNSEGIDAYWEQRIRENGQYENVYTVGIRGIHDSAMIGGRTTSDKVALLQRVITDQREMLAHYVNPHVEQVPQIFVPYKEVLTLYQNGLKVPDDVTLVWPDDNYGYIRQLSTPEEQKRSGGSGVYYHLSYWGQPEDYLWLCTTPPALVWEEMSKAYNQGAHTVWVVNVGDIKPAEIDLEFFMRMAWNMNGWDERAQPTFLADWAQRTFGQDHSVEIAAILDEYYRLNYAAKPEHLLLAQFTTNYGEIGERLRRFTALVEKTNALYEKIAPELKDAFYEMIVYPVRCSALMNEKHLASDPRKREEAYNQIQSETGHYNQKVAGGKWNHMMSASPRNRPVFNKITPKAESAATPTPEPNAHNNGGYVSIDAGNPARAINGMRATWKTIVGLGCTGDAIALLPVGQSVPATVALEYEFTASNAGPAKVLVYAIPTHALNTGLKLRYSVSIDNEPPKEVNLETAEFSQQWSANVIRAAAIGTTEHFIALPGKHTIKIHPVDPGVVFEKIVIDFGGLKPTHLGPPATKHSCSEG